MMQKPKPQTLPLSPGVYIYKNAQGRIIYIGKARILRRRILSYFRTEGLPAKTVAMLRHAVSIDTISTTTEKEALLLEASLIKKHSPHYNIILRDDKQYVLFKIATKHHFPRLEVVRKTRRDGARYFGPFTSAAAARETWKLIHRVFPLRRCTDKAMKNRVRACLYYHMGQCPAPCTQDVNPSIYAETVRKVADILSGRSSELLQSLEKDMLTASEALDFERAALLRDQWRAIQHTVERQVAVLPKGGDLDILGLHAAEKGMALGIIFVRGGLLMDGKTYFWAGLDFEDTPELLLSFLAQFYGAVTPPPRIILPWLPTKNYTTAHSISAEISKAEHAHQEQSAMADSTEEEDTEDADMLLTLEQSLADIRGGTVRIAAPRSAEEHSLVDMAATNAKEEALRRKEQPTEEHLEERLALALQLTTPPSRIECVDVSHTAGQQTRVGMVVFLDGKAHTSAYRNYSMPDGGGDDYATLYAWVARRLKSGPPWPDLLLIDGGKGQLRAVQKGLQDAGQENLFALAAIAKARDEHGHADRRAGNMNDRIFLPQRSNPLPLREGSAELLFLQHVRDCTHNFAIGRHRKARGKAAFSGEIMRLPGIGEHTARQLWEHFSTKEAMLNASQEDLQKLHGIGKAKAKALWEKLQSLTGHARISDK